MATNLSKKTLADAVRDVEDLGKFINSTGTITNRTGGTFPALQTLIGTVTGGGLTTLSLDNGTISNPSLKFINDTDTGIYYSSGKMSFTHTSTLVAQIDATGLKLPENPLAISEGGTGVRSLGELTNLLSIQSGTKYEHTQSSPQSVWTINHNLGFYPTVQTFTVGGVEIFGDILNVSVNQTTITWGEPVSGLATFR